MKQACLMSMTWSGRRTVALLEHAAQWIGHYVQHQKVWGSIPSTSHASVEVLGKLCISHCFDPPQP